MQNEALISRKALLEEYEWMMTQVAECNKPILQEHIDRINRQPVVDAEPVRHGKWMTADGMLPPERHGRKFCSACAKFALNDYFGRERLSLYCPHCGANLVEEEQHD